MRIPPLGIVHGKEGYRCDDGDGDLVPPPDVEEVVKEAKHGGYEDGEQGGEVEGELG